MNDNFFVKSKITIVYFLTWVIHKRPNNVRFTYLTFGWEFAVRYPLAAVMVVATFAVKNSEVRNSILKTRHGAITA